MASRVAAITRTVSLGSWASAARETRGRARRRTRTTRTILGMALSMTATSGRETEMIFRFYGAPAPGVEGENGTRGRRGGFPPAGTGEKRSLLTVAVLE